MNEEITITIQGWETSADNPETIVDDLKEYAREVFGWTDTVPDPNFVFDPENPDTVASEIDNPKSYITVIFNEKPMSDFWLWLRSHKSMEKMDAINTNLSIIRDQTNVITQ